MRATSFERFEFWKRRRWVVAALLGILALCIWHTEGPWFRRGHGMDIWTGMARFLRAAVEPAFEDESTTLPDGVTPFLTRALADLFRTVRYALVAMSIAVPLGLLLGLLTSTAWWPSGVALGQDRRPKRMLLALLRLVRWTSRGVIAFMRSIHELIWAMFFLSAVGDAPITGCVALALPFAGTLGKVFSELIEEQSKHAKSALENGGAASHQAFAIATLPEIFPQLVTYTAYRFECAIRSSAVLGFIGVETIGLTIRRSFENLYFREVWTSLYLLIVMIILVDRLSAWVRYRLQRVPSGAANLGQDEITLRRRAPRDRWLRAVFALTAMSIFVAWMAGEPLSRGLTNAGDRSARLARFFTKLTPEPARPEDPFIGLSERLRLLGDQASEVWGWVVRLWLDPGKEALLNTLSMATAAIILAAWMAVILVPWSSRGLATIRPFGLAGSPGKLQRWWWWSCGVAIRTGFVLSRSIPEYILAFLLVGIMGPSAWPLIVALAVHNTGVLGKLWGETVENQDPHSPRQVILTGASRAQAYLFAVLPNCFNRFLLFFFYRWETCLREATILGMLGISSLGYHISISRNYLQYDRMLFFVLSGAVVIFAGDLFSDWLRKRLRE